MMDDVTKDVEAPISNEAQAGGTEIGLGITDLRVFKEVIDVASARGAFTPNEFATIGDAYGRLNAFLVTIDSANVGATDETDTDETDELETDETDELETDETDATDDTEE